MSHRNSLKLNKSAELTQLEQSHLQWSWWRQNWRSNPAHRRWRRSDREFPRKPELGREFPTPIRFRRSRRQSKASRSADRWACSHWLRSSRRNWGARGNCTCLLACWSTGMSRGWLSAVVVRSKESFFSHNYRLRGFFLTYKVLVEPRESWFSVIVEDQDSVDHFWGK